MIALTEIVLITSSILNGKISYRKQATLYLEISATNDDPEMEVVVTVDDQVLLSQSLLSTVTKLTHKINDEPGEHTLCITLKGNPTGAMLRIKCMQIEGLNMQNTMADSGTCIMGDTPHIPSEYMGQVGYQSLKFTTPIYPWLLKNEKHDQYYL